MNLSGNYFYYDGKSSAHYGLKIMQLNTERLKQLSGDIQYQTAYSRATKTFAVNGIKYSDYPMEFEIEFISEQPIRPEISRTIKNWLFNRAKYKRLYSDAHHDNTRSRVNGVTKREFLECVFYGAEEIRFSDGLHGWKAKCLTSSIMAQQEEVELTFTSFANDIVVPVDTDIDDYVFPLMGITTRTGASSESDITITNKSDGRRTFQLVGVHGGSVITVNNEVGTVLTNASVSLYEKLTDKKFFRLVPGENTLTVSGAVEKLTLKWSNARWLV